jgi:glycosyltransferase involved in cell wall biosynthesis
MEKRSIAFIAPIKRAITPDTTVSRNRVIVDLASGLVKRGHAVTIFGTGDSYLPGVTFVPVVPHPLRSLPPVENDFYQYTSYLTILIKEVQRRQGEFALIHNHAYPEYMPLLSDYKTPLLTTIHSQMTPLTAQVLAQFQDCRFVAISKSAALASGLNTIDIVHNSVDCDFFHPVDGDKTYYLTVGRMSKAKDENGRFMDPKGIGNAISIAEQSGIRLKIVGNVEDPQFFETIVRPHLSERITFVGDVSSEQSISREQMRALFAGAIGLINPIQWEEPFGLVMAEALACSTPVIAFNRGAVSEIVSNESVGRVVDPVQGVSGFVEALKDIPSLSRDACRAHAIAEFSTDTMVEKYEKIYSFLMQ